MRRTFYALSCPERRSIMLRLIANDCSDYYLAREHNVVVAVIQKIKEDLIFDYSHKINTPISGLLQKTPYFEFHNGVTAEDQMLSEPYYNPLELMGEELKIYNKL